MPADSSSDAQLELAHVLFIDIVGYSKRLINEQTALVKRLNELVLQTEQCRKADAAGKLIRIPTGDGMALAFFTSPDAPVRCAMELSKADQADPKLELRMGIHTGPVDQVSDVNRRSNIAGAGINMAQRVMDCGDAGHILLSKHVAEDLEQYGHWQQLLHDLGTCEVKHRVRLGVVNLYTDGVGNPQLPKRFVALKKRRTRVRYAAIATALLLLTAISAAFVIVFKKTTRPASSVSEKSIAVLPFENLSEDKANAYFADGIQDEILTKLATIADLKVISRTSTAKYKSKPEDLRTVSQQLGVATVLEGSVQKAVDKVRVNVQLIDARADSHLWAKSYDRDLKDVFAVESEVAQEIADALRAEHRQRLSDRFAIHVLAGDTARLPEEIDRARGLVEARVRERPDDKNALVQLAWIDVAINQKAEALKLAQRSAELLPPEKDAVGGSVALGGLAEIEARTGHTKEAVKTLQRLLSIPAGLSIQRLKIDPVWDPIRNDPGFQQLLAGKELVGPDR